MKFKVAILALYALVFLIPVCLATGSFAHSEPETWNSSAGATRPRQVSSQRITIKLDTMGFRGLALFDHQEHQAEINPDPRFPHKAIGNLACIGCHHTVKDITDSSQFQKCSNCHKQQGDAKNPADTLGIELNSREIYHRLCISCHRADHFKASNERVKDASFTKCGECHDNSAVYTAAVQPMEQQPPLPEPAQRPRFVNPPPVGSIQNPFDKPSGYSGPSRIKAGEQSTADFVPIPDRWRIGFPDDPRYVEGRLLNPYRQNLLKGDYPILGQHNFAILTAESDSLVDFRRVPVPSDVSAQNPDSEEFFGRGEQSFFRQNFSISFEWQHGDTAFKPADWRIHITPNFNVNYLNTNENGIVNIDVRNGKSRTDSYIALEDAFVEVRLGDTTRLFPFLRGKGSQGGESPFFDTTSIRTGIQPFVSDFRGFVFSDVNLGSRLFGNFGSNRYQYNFAYFSMLEKDTNSELNTLHSRDQSVFVANFFRQDTFKKGYTSQFSFHYNNDRPSTHFDENGFLVRPSLVGDAAPHGIKVAYLGWTGDGHFGRLNITHAFYEALGHDTHNPIAGRPVNINAQMAAAELSEDRDWLRLRGSFFWSSGDKNPLDGTARGFDSIVDFPEFAGGQFSFWNSQEIRLTQTGVALTSSDSLLPSLRSSKNEGQANFINPGIFIYNAGADAEVTQKLKAVFNINYLRFHHTEPLELLLFQPGIRHDIGLDYGGGVIYRPFLSENVILSAGVSSLIPGSGFKDIYSSVCTGQGCGAKPRNLYSAFVRLRITY
ncbi:MAG TPA: cytochrome c3 family protein [Blastocatellia bacterium]|nr:cytochrome c3 family protein [Blastocatellia bacterium]